MRIVLVVFCHALICYLLSANSVAFTQKKQINRDITISGFQKDLMPGDTIRLQYWDHYLSENHMQEIPCRTFFSSNRKGAFCFHIKTAQMIAYFSLSLEKYKNIAIKPILDHYCAEKGDNISIDIGKIKPMYQHFGSGDVNIVDWEISSIRFTGPGSAKYNCRYRIEEFNKKRIDRLQEIAKKIEQPLPAVFDSSFFSHYPNELIESLQDQNTLLVSQLAILRKYKNSMSTSSFQLMRLDLIGYAQFVNCRNFGFYYLNLDNNLSPPLLLNLQRRLIRIYKTRKSFSKKEPPSLLAASKNYINFLTMDAFLAKYTYHMDGFEVLKNKYNGLLRDKLLTEYIVQFLRDIDSGMNIMDTALLVVHTPYCRDILVSMNSAQRKGNPAFQFALQNIMGKSIKLGDFKGKLIFIDFWFSGCGACLLFYRNQLSKVETFFENNSNIIFISVSIDKDKAIWEKSIKEGMYTSPNAPNVINLYTNGRGDEHPMIKAYNISSYPRPIIIDRNARIFKTTGLQVKANKLIQIIQESLK